MSESRYYYLIILLLVTDGAIGIQDQTEARTNQMPMRLLDTCGQISTRILLSQLKHGDSYCIVLICFSRLLLLENWGSNKYYGMLIDNVANFIVQTD
ncbi:hypothetical protein F4777DRAFT_499571 [Nemania sp. FL0916]|nr:hypothetical protein F4777DRAFT_499571 [Nemania sp. FL0916]